MRIASKLSMVALGIVLALTACQTCDSTDEAQIQAAENHCARLGKNLKSVTILYTLGCASGFTAECSDDEVSEPEVKYGTKSTWPMSP
jgi:hypothetical protein